MNDDSHAIARTTYPLTWLRGLAALAVVTFHAYQHNRAAAEQRLALVGRRPPGDARHRAVRGDVLRALRLRALAAGRTHRARRPRGPTRAGCCCSAGWRGCCRCTTRWCWSSGRSTNPDLPGHWQDLVLHLTFTHVYSDQYIFWTDGPAWSLAVEFHFYVLMALSVPLVHAAVRRTSQPAGPDRDRLGAAGRARRRRPDLPRVGDRLVADRPRELVGAVLAAVPGRRLRHRHRTRGDRRCRCPARPTGADRRRGARARRSGRASSPSGRSC